MKAKLSSADRTRLSTLVLDAVSLARKAHGAAILSDPAWKDDEVAELQARADRQLTELFEALYSDFDVEPLERGGSR